MDPFIGQIMLVGFNFAPRGWALCNGQLLSIAQNSALFALLGIQFGGDGRTTFGLPDLRGRAPIHYGAGPGLSNYSMGEMGGSESAQLTVSNLPPHTHSLPAPAGEQLTDRPSASVSPAIGNAYGQPSGVAGATGVTGGSTPFDIRTPFLAMSYVIALEGIFPSRD